MKKQIRILAAAVVLAFTPALHAQATTAVPSEKNSGQNLVATKIADDFYTFAGGEENALALVNALRAGTDATLVTVVPPPAGSPAGTLPTTTQTTVAVPTKPMGWGNVKHSLALARDQLARAGITNPTAAQLQTALNGGDLVVTNADGTTRTTTVKGILTMRADGMGWGNIAKEGGTKLGHVQKVDMSAKSVKSPPATTTPTVTTAAGPAPTTTKSTKGITTAAGGNVSATTDKGPKGVTTAAGASANQGSKGVVTAGGGNAGSNGQGNAYGRGIVTGAGASATNVAATSHGKGAGVSTGTGVVTGGGNGNGKGGGNGNGKVKGG
jgi:hypothetical protein